MNLLIEFTPPGGILQRISNNDIELTALWKNLVISFSSFRVDMSKDYGGYDNPSFSDIEINPDALVGYWPPQPMAKFKIMISNDAETDIRTIFDGYGSPEDFDRESVKYTLSNKGYTNTKSTRQLGTLDSLFTSYCTTLGLTYNGDAARAVSPSVDYTPSSSVLLTTLMAGMSSFFTHGFKIVGDVLYLYDMLATGTQEGLTEFDVLPCSYGSGAAVASVSSGNISVTGNDSGGKEITISTAYHTGTTEITAALTNILTMLEKEVATIPTMIDLTTVTMLDDFTMYDESTIEPTSTVGKAISTLYNFDDYKLTIEAKGVLS